MKSAQLAVGGTSVDVSHLDKVFYPGTGFTKGDVIDYYVRVSPVLLPHLTDRPVTLKRYPNGVEGPFFYEKRCPSHRPDWVETAKVPRTEGGAIDYCVLNDLPALVWAVNLADLEIHPFLHRAPAVDQPTMVVFDLDPGPSADILLCCQVALWLQDLLGTMDLKCFPKTSGSKGMQVCVPLNRLIRYEETKAFARGVAERLEKHFPERVVARMQKQLRAGKVLLDWSQNDRHKTTVSVYSLRARERPTVSMPVAWPELEAALRQGDAESLVFSPDHALERVEKQGDIFSPVLELKQKLP